MKIIKKEKNWNNTQEENLKDIDTDIFSEDLNDKKNNYGNDEGEEFSWLQGKDDGNVETNEI